MGYNGLAKELRKRWGKGRKSEADDAARDSQPEPIDAADGADDTPDWDESAQDHISALLGDVSGDSEDDDELDLAAIRQALIEKKKAQSSKEPEHRGGDDLFLVIDEILAPETPETAPPPSAHKKPPTAPGPPGALLPGDEDISPLSPTAVVMEPVLKDVVVAELLSEGIVTLPQALTAVRRQEAHPGSSLWRILAELPGISRPRIFGKAADLLGYETVTIDEAFSVAELEGVMAQLPGLLRRKLLAFNLLPYPLKNRAVASPGWVMVTHDPSLPELKAVLKKIDTPVHLYYAPEAVVAHHLKELKILLEEAESAESDADDAGAIDLTFTSDDKEEATADAFFDSEGTNDAEQETNIIDLQEEDDFLELHWEPFDDDADEDKAVSPPKEPRGRADRPALEWKPLGELADEAERDLGMEDRTSKAHGTTVEQTTTEADGEFTFELTSEELERLEKTDALPIDDVFLDDKVAQELLDDFSGPAFDKEGPPARNGSPSFDGISLDLSDHDAPVPDVSDWTQRRASDAAAEREAPTPPAEPQRPVAPVSFEEALSFDEPPQPVDPPRPEPEPVHEEPTIPEVPSPPVVPPTAEQPAPPVEEAAPEPEEEEVDEVNELSPEELKKIRSKDRVVGMLLRKKAVGARQIRQALKKQKDEKIKEPLWRILTLLDSVDRNVIFAEAASVYAFKTAEIQGEKADPEFARSVMNTFEEQLRDSLLKLRVVPLEVDLDPQTGAIKVVFITHDPTRPEVHRVMQKLKLERFELRYAPETIVTGLIYEAFPRKNEFLERLDGHDAVDLGMSYDESNDLIDEDALEAEINRSKLINLFEATLVEAVRQDASDVHIWPNDRKQVEIHFRIDGRLRRWHVEDKVHPEAFIAVIKDNSMNVDRFERDAAQDGFIQRWIDEALIRFRVSVLPIANAAQDVRSESIVIRVLDDRKVVKDLARLGLNQLALRRFRKAISQPHGMVILTGPTGSGKTTTLYASLHEVINPEVNVLTVEDPVEYILPGVRQIKLNNKLGLDGALRSILRHDPDVVMVGEMRDKPTAELAIKLANTGHLTFSTLHTNDAASAVTRLYKMGIEPFLIAYAINLVVAQRLIRRLCPTCKVVDPDPDHVLMRKLGFTDEEIEKTTIYTQGEDDNCPTCKGVRFKGRRAVSEAMYFSREIRHLIADSEQLDEMDIKDLAIEQGMFTLTDSAREVVKEGDSSIMEMMRVVSTEE